MVLFLDLWSALVLGILYLSFGGVPYVFSTQYGLYVPNPATLPCEVLLLSIPQFIAANRSRFPRHRFRSSRRCLLSAIFQQTIPPPSQGVRP